MNSLYKCSKCKNMLPKDQFYWNKEHRNNSRCKPCRNIALKEYRRINGDKIAKQRKDRYYSNQQHHLDRSWGYGIKSRYGVTRQQYEIMVLEQDNKCKICKTSDYRKLSIDHCHKTKAIRGLLCQKCNHGIGLFNDNPNLLQEAIIYLNKPK